MHGLRTLIFDVADLAAAKAFYADVLGSPPYFDEPFYVGFDVEGYELGLRPAEADRQPGTGGATAYLGVDDVDAALARLVERGAKVRESAQDVGEGIRVASVIDPFGNVLGLIQNLSFAPKLTAAAADDLSERSIRIEQVIPLPRSEVWSLWTTSDGIARWLVEQAKIELRPGGAYEVYFLLDQPIGSRGSETCRVLSFIPQRMVSFTWNAPPHLVVTRHQHTWVVIELEDAPGGTRLTVTHTGWPASGLRDVPQWEETFQYFERAWAGVMGALDTFARTGKRA
jgi:uncharacterized protein YndB with AHSA1/START domain/predicted enzyme related to lactoylglutathione lyase